MDDVWLIPIDIWWRLNKWLKIPTIINDSRRLIAKISASSIIQKLFSCLISLSSQSHRGSSLEPHFVFVHHTNSNLLGNKPDGVCHTTIITGKRLEDGTKFLNNNHWKTGKSFPITYFTPCLGLSHVRSTSGHILPVPGPRLYCVFSHHNFVKLPDTGTRAATATATDCTSVLLSSTMLGVLQRVVQNFETNFMGSY